MQNTFTLHCITWQASASMLKEVRMEAYKMGLLSLAETLMDPEDEQHHHALVLSESGKAIGCARITLDGKVERMAVLLRENSTEIESALKLAAMLNAYRPSHYA